MARSDKAHISNIPLKIYLFLLFIHVCMCVCVKVHTVTREWIFLELELWAILTCLICWELNLGSPTEQ